MFNRFLKISVFSIVLILLSVIAYIRYKDSLEKLKEKAVISNMNYLKYKLESFYLKKGGYPLSLWSLDSLFAIDSVRNPYTEMIGIREKGAYWSLSDTSLISDIKEKEGMVFYIPSSKDTTQNICYNYLIIGFGGAGKRLTNTIIAKRLDR